MRMLLVEDDAAIVASLTDLLRSEGYETRCADGQGRGRRAAANDERFDLALVDVRMPELDGIGMLEAVQAQGFKPMVIVLSAIRISAMRSRP